MATCHLFGNVLTSLPARPETVAWGFSFLLRGLFMFEIESSYFHLVPGIFPCLPLTP